MTAAARCALVIVASIVGSLLSSRDIAAGIRPNPKLVGLEITVADSKHLGNHGVGLVPTENIVENTSVFQVWRAGCFVNNAPLNHWTKPIGFYDDVPADVRSDDKQAKSDMCRFAWENCDAFRLGGASALDDLLTELTETSHWFRLFPPQHESVCFERNIKS